MNGKSLKKNSQVEKITCANGQWHSDNRDSERNYYCWEPES